ncbi:hypothetical protein FHL15_004339 [Xylaria flabelliformis]|uniref:Uncharacterized protein n=1 Tax=Xylaria flabelliformis TaxID=2512241 RepID=A0A553I3U1_9PEZI|nr:hypothetical protein FHL15_004339 [Xylaria flabelliformis]
MTDSHGGHSSHIEQAPLDSQQFGQAQNILDEQKSNYGNTTQSDLGSHAEAHKEAIKDQIDGATAKGPKRADQSTGGRVQVGETGDLHDLAARRQS